MKVSKDLMAASSTPLVLAILADGESYGYAIVKRVRELSDGQLEWTDGLLYPLLHRLEDAGHIESRWGRSETGRRRRYYRLTAAGTREISEQRRQWAAVAAALDSAWQDLREATAAPLPAPGVAR
ncbi:helix-turn-helix transcriptional regulator [Demequina capsici]|uniref:Helix-turn-helix transcriptional regulator n=1 Tax=Demequina capsici TaxID=3075620 RepID=A0AA96F4L4_9MICO|nr:MULTISPECIES: helix-turn-helix transcriptional regulator [unclassified Demequina]WNM23649.1 helix-turn-helix transcriptional regulator [Demequina sp. OYTSA14]WNM26488.1 helix-turn-helix transcriptional regulator [Demequina sp. PMTSA13]